MTNFPESSPALILLNWLSHPDELPSFADAAIGFGHFDRRIPATCGTFLTAGQVHHLVFSGGIGAGTGTLGGPEADFFRAELRRHFPTITDERISLENRSTNTAENIRFTAQCLATDPRLLALGKAIRSVILVVHPLRLRRVRQTWRKLQPAIPAAAVAPATTLATEHELYVRENLLLEKQLIGEIDRLRDYPARGWIEPVMIPREILTARDQLAEKFP